MVPVGPDPLEILCLDDVTMLMADNLTIVVEGWGMYCLFVKHDFVAAITLPCAFTLIFVIINSTISVRYIGAVYRCGISVRYIGAVYQCGISVRYIGAVYRCCISARYISAVYRGIGTVLLRYLFHVKYKYIVTCYTQYSCDIKDDNMVKSTTITLT